MPRHAVGWRLATGILLGALVSGAVVVLALGIRPDLEIAMHGFAFWMKWAYTISLSIVALAMTAQLARPDGGRMRWLWLAAIPVFLLACVGVVELIRTPPAEWLAMWLGHSWMVCPWLVLALAMPIFIGLLWSFRRLAPTRLRAAGAAAGLGGGRVRGDRLLPALSGGFGDLRADLVFARHPAGGIGRRAARAAPAALVNFWEPRNRPPVRRELEGPIRLSPFSGDPNMTILRTGISFAAAAAVVAITAAAPTVAVAKGGALVHCYGVNTCKGMSDCKSGNHECKGQNDCKGQGFKALSTKACKAAGGSLTAPN